MTDPQMVRGEGRTLFTAVLFALLGVFNIVQGLVLIVEDESWIATSDPDLVLVGDFTTWGWILLLLGIFQLIVSGALFSGQLWARVVGIIGASLVAIAQLPLLASTSPFWSLIIIVICIWLIYGMAVYGTE